MSKQKVKDIAKKLNTKSKRIIEKLEEIKIQGKGPMSTLEEEEIEKLYSYIGYIKPEEKKKEEKKVVKKAVSKDTPKMSKQKKQRIIRRTEVIVDDDKKKEEKKKKKSYVVSSDDSGLMAGLQRANKYSRRKKASSVKSSKINDEQNQNKQKNEEKAKESKNDKKQDKNINISKDNKVSKDSKETKETKASKASKEVKEAKEDKASKDTKADKASKEAKKDKASKEAKKEKVSKEVKVDKASKEAKEDKTSREAKKEKVSKEAKVDKASKEAKVDKASKEAKVDKASKEVKEDKASKKAKEDKASKDTKADKASKKAKEAKEAKASKEDKASKDTKETKVTKESKDTSKSKETKDTKRIDVNKNSKKSKSVQKGKDKSTLGEKDKKDKEKVFKVKKSDKSSKKSKSSPKVKTNEINSRNEEKKLKDTARMFSNKKNVKKAVSKKAELEYHSHSRRRRNKNSKRTNNKKVQKPAIPNEIEIEENISVKELATIMKKTASSVITKLMALGVMATINDTIDFDTATLVAEEFDISTRLKEVETEEDILFDDTSEKEENLESRPPVVVVMGHVDHGKTSVLDAIKSTKIIDTEAGGITQHIGAYMVNIKGKDITFLDTPGHEAFTSLRARGAQVTDIAILVVAADDGIMPQTIEAINHAKAAGVEIIVAINKIDKANANVERVKQELTEYELVPEEWGGDTICVPISALKNENIDELLEMILLTSELLELKASPKKQAKGTVIEARLDKAKGALATLLVQRGTLKEGDSIVTGTTVGRIRAMSDYKGQKISKATPSTPVEIFGLSDVPTAGELFYAVDDYKTARQLVEKRKDEIREEEMKKKNAVTLDDLFDQIKEGEIKELNIVVKADVQGSLEAIKQSLAKLSNDEVKVNVVHSAVGTITETDVSLAQVSNAIIIGFNVRPPATVTEIAKENGIDIRLYSIIYEALEDVENAMKGLLDPTYKEQTTGHAEVRDIFKVSGVGTIAGCYVQDGKINRNSKIRLVRDGIVIHDGELNSLKRFKDDVKEVSSGYECGLSIEKFNDIKVGDVIEAYEMVEVER